MKNMLNIFQCVVYLFATTLVCTAQSIRAGSDSSLELNPRGKISFKAAGKVAADTASLSIPSYLNWKSLPKIASTGKGFKASGVIIEKEKSQEVSICETDYEPQEDNKVLVHSEVKYLKSQKYPILYTFAFYFAVKDKDGIAREGAIGATCEVIEFNEHVSNYSLHKEIVKNQERVKRITIRKGPTITILEPGKNTSLTLIDSRNSHTDAPSLVVKLDPDGDPHQRVGQTAITEAFVQVKKNDQVDNP
jgi:hypothetical protein